MTRLFGYLLKILATLFGVLAVLVIIASWRIATWAATAKDVTPYLQSVLSIIAPDVVAEIGQSSLVWDNKKQTLSLSCAAVTIKNSTGDVVAGLEEGYLRLRIWNLMRGRIIPQELKVSSPKLWLIRDANGVVSTGLHTRRTETEKEIRDAVDFLLLQIFADELADGKLKHIIDVTNGQIFVRDKLDGLDWSLLIPKIKLTHDASDAKGILKIELHENGKNSTLDLNYGYDSSSKMHQIAMEFHDIKPTAFAAQKLKLDALKVADFPISGKADFYTDRDLNISKASIEVQGQQGHLRDPALWDKPRAISKMVLNASYDEQSEKLAIPVFEIDFGGARLGGTLDAKIPAPKDIIWRSNKLGNNAFTAKITLDNVPMDEFGTIWPKTIIPDARNWIVTSLSKGVFTHGEVTVKGKVKLDDLENITLESGGGLVTAKDGVVNYLEGMPAIENASAEAVFDLDHMDVKILTGNTGAIKVQPFTLTMDHFQEDVQYITIPVKLTGPVPDVLRVLDSPPLGYAREMGLNPSDSSGHVEGVLTLHMPLLDALLLKDVDVKAQASISDFGSQNLIPQIALSSGNLQLDLTKTGFDLKGAVALNTVPAQVVWKSNFGTNGDEKKPLHDGTITATVKGSQWGLFYGLDSLAKVDGDTPVTIKYTNVRSGYSRVMGQVALKQASVRLRDIGWNKPVDEQAQLLFTLEIPRGKNMVFRSIDLQGDDIKVKGTAELDEETGKLVLLNFKPFVLGRSNALVFYSRPVDPRQALTISVEGESFDLNGIDDGIDTKEQKNSVPDINPVDPEIYRPKHYTVKLSKLYTSQDGYLSSVSGHARKDKIGWTEIDLIGIAQGSNPLSIKLTPQNNGKTTFLLTSDNFGAAFQGLGFGAGVKGGEIEINGESAPDNPRAIQGKIKITSFVVTDLPLLARLLSAVSPFGFVDLITGDASFDHLRGYYRWLGDDIELKDVRAAGSVVGININGHVNIDSGVGNLSGTLVPFSFVNSIIGSIPLLGDVITGGSGQGVVAAAYTVKGQMSDPNVSVNPVSLLTPGFLRSLFFSGDDAKGNQEGK